MSPASAARGSGAPAVIRKYANRRLYNTATGQFVTLADLHEMIRRGDDFVVREAKTDRDITAWVLAQIVAEEAGRGNNLLSLDYLRRLLRFYHEGLGEHLSAYLESSMELFAANQRDLVRNLSNPFDPVGALAAFRELGERNAEYFTRLVQSATGGSRDPSASGASGAPSEPGEPEPPAAPGPEPPAEERGAASAASPGDDIQALRAQLLALQHRLDAIERRRDDWTSAPRPRSGSARAARSQLAGPESDE